MDVRRIQEDNMAEVIGVRFKEVGKVYYFDPLGKALRVGDMVIVETARGLECGEVALANKTVDDNSLAHPLKPLIRIATEKDLNHLAENHLKEKNARKICEQKIAAHGLKMKLVNVEYTFDNSKIIFYFTADGRFCCNGFMGEFQPVSIKMAKEQGLSLSPVKISGTCGRLMCCLKYEQEAYTDLLKHTPKVGAIVNTPEGRGLVVENNLIARTLKVKLDNAPADVAPKTFTVRQCKLVRDGYIKVNKKELEQLGNLE